MLLTIRGRTPGATYIRPHSSYEMGPWGRRVGTWWGRGDVPILVRLGPGGLRPDHSRPGGIRWLGQAGSSTDWSLGAGLCSARAGEVIPGVPVIARPGLSRPGLPWLGGPRLDLFLVLCGLR